MMITIKIPYLLSVKKLKESMRNFYVILLNLTSELMNFRIITVMGLKIF